MTWRGFALARRAVSGPVCTRLRNEALASAHQLQWRPAHLLARLLGQTKIRAPSNRVHLKLSEVTSDVRTVLHYALCGIGQSRLARAGLGQEASLVELSVMVAFPGARQQAVHTDIAPGGPPGMCTLWCALQHTDATMGPTVLLPADPDAVASSFDWAALERQAAAVSFGKTFSSDGEADTPEYEAESVLELAHLGLGEPMLMEMGVGDGGPTRERHASLYSTATDALSQCVARAQFFSWTPARFTMERRTRAGLRGRSSRPLFVLHGSDPPRPKGSRTSSTQTSSGSIDWATFSSAKLGAQQQAKPCERASIHARVHYTSC